MAKWDLITELFYGGAWQSADAYVRNPVTISRGRDDEQGEAGPSSASSTLDNRDGSANPRNPLSPLYGLAGRNTPIRHRLGTPVVEDFEDATLNITVANTGDAAWARTNTHAHGGTWSFKSGTITANQHSEAWVDVPAGSDSLTFWYKVSSEEGFDLFEVWADGTRVVLTASGIVDWTRATVDVSHVGAVVFRYGKDAAVSTGDDAAYVDDIEFAAVRLAGEVAKWAPDRTVDFDQATGKGDAWAKVDAAGVLRRLGQGNPPAESALRRAILLSDPIAYWPLEDGVDTGHFASALPSGTPMTIVGDSPKFAEVTDVPAGSSPLLLMPTTFLSAIHAPITGATSGATTFGIIMRVPDNNTGALVINIIVRTSTGFGDGIILGNDVITVVDDQWHYLEVRMYNSGSDAKADWYRDGVFIGDDTVTSTTVGVPTEAIIEIHSDPSAVEDNVPRVGHFAVWQPTPGSGVDLVDAMNAYAGERAGTRFLRLCGEENIPASLVGAAADTPTMGPQSVDTLVNLFAEIERTDVGLLYEPRGVVGLAYRTLTDLYNQNPVLELDWTSGEVAPPLTPTIDDLPTRNDITVKRANGSSDRAVRESGPLNVNLPTDDPDGVGRVKTEVSVNPQLDTALPDLAHWYLHLGTIDETRFPSVTVDLDASPSLATAAAVDVGDRITLDNLPADLSPDLVSLTVVGITETIGSHRRLLTFNCVPESAWQVAVYDTDRYESSGTERGAPQGSIDTTQTSITFTITDGPFWITTANQASQFPFDINVGGERMTVTGIAAPSGATQLFTVVRSVNGVVKSHPAGTKVRLWKQARYAL